VYFLQIKKYEFGDKNEETIMMKTPVRVLLLRRFKILLTSGQTGINDIFFTLLEKTKDPETKTWTRSTVGVVPPTFRTVILYFCCTMFITFVVQNPV
jgi:hypothetical protein